jgi:FRG domain
MKIEEVIEVERLAVFIDTTNRNHADKTVYRGLPNHEFKLVPSIGRYPYLCDDAGFVWSTFAAGYLEKFTNELAAFGHREELLKEERWAIAQHHGMITPLLDWTRNPLVALYFAVSHVLQKQDDDKNNSVIWALKDFEEYYPRGESKTPDSKRAVVIFPRHLSPRFIAQKGCFTLHDWPPGRERFIPLEEKDSASALIKYVIPAKSKKGLRMHLNKIGVNEATLFPDLGGVCKHLTWQMTNTNLHHVVAP